MSNRYTSYGFIEQTTLGLGWWNITSIPADVSDVDFYVTAEFVGRPDLISYYLYEDPNLMWVVMLFNRLYDVSEIELGRVLRVPTKSRVAAEILDV